jgi:predicted RNase H-like HicB family nuclease
MFKQGIILKAYNQINYMEKNYKFAGLFGKNSNPDQVAVEKMMEQIQAVGGMLHFAITKEEDGWSAQCDELPGIITGGISSSPAEAEIEANVRAAIHAAFNLSSSVRSEEVIHEKAITEVRTFQLA